MQRLPKNAADALRQLFFEGPTLNEELNQRGRTWLGNNHFTRERMGWTYLNPFGIDMALDYGLGIEKVRAKEQTDGDKH